MTRTRRRWIPVALAAVLALGALVWLVLPAQGSPDAAGESGSSPGAGGSANPSTTWEPTTPDPEILDAPDGATGPDGVEAARVIIPSIGVDTALISLGVDPRSGVLVPPERFDVAGLFSAGTFPGEIGPAIIAGHVDSTDGPAVFYRLEELLPDAVISVILSDGEEIDFTVVAVEQYPKTAFPTARVYGPTPDRALRLITCGGDFDRNRRSYLDNIVVYAVRT